MRTRHRLSTRYRLCMRWLRMRCGAVRRMLVHHARLRIARVAVLLGNGKAFSTGADVKARQCRSREEFERVWPPARLGEIPHGNEELFGTEPLPPSGEEAAHPFAALADLKKGRGGK